MLKIFSFQMKAHDQVLALDGLIKIREQSALEELDPEPKEDCDCTEVGWVACTQWSWPQGAWWHWLEQAASRNWTRNYDDACLLWRDSEGEVGVFVSQTSVLDCYEDILKEKTGSLSAKLQCLIAMKIFWRRRRGVCQPNPNAWLLWRYSEGEEGMFVSQTSGLDCCEDILKETKEFLSARLRYLIAMKRFWGRRRGLCQPDFSAWLLWGYSEGEEEVFVGQISVLDCYEDILKEKKRFLSAKFQCLIAMRIFWRRRRGFCQPNFSAWLLWGYSEGEDHMYKYISSSSFSSSPPPPPSKFRIDYLEPPSPF